MIIGDLFFLALLYWNTWVNTLGLYRVLPNLREHSYQDSVLGIKHIDRSDPCDNHIRPHLLPTGPDIRAPGLAHKPCPGLGIQERHQAR